MNQLNYRPDIDGLRALAVLSVFLFHINATWIPNGFLGVDIFFVISGFLISSIIYRDVRAKMFSFQEFYKRRIKRILPTFFTVVFFCIIASNLIIAPGQDLQAFSNSALASVTFLANIFFARGQSYFDTAVGEKPLLHIWSLSVEEQYYFLAPIAIILLLRFEWSYKYRYYLLGLLMSLLLITSITGFPEFKFYYGQTYYLPHLRFVEMGVGSLLAFLSVDGKLPKLPNARWSMAVSTISLGALFACFYAPVELFQPPLFPGFSALIPCIATATLIWGNQGQHWVNELFSLKPIVQIGKYSYSLYLWHWSVLAYFRYIYEVEVLSPMQLLGALGLIIALTLMSYYLVEQPTRHSRLGFKQSLLWGYLAPASIVVALYLFPLQKADPDILFDEGKILFNELTAEGKGILGDTTKQPRVAIVGDSHGAQLAAFFDTLGHREGWSAFAICGRAAPFILNYPVHKSDWKTFARERDKLILDNIDNYDVVVIPGYWGSDELRNVDNLLELIDATLDTLRRSDKSVYLLNTLTSVAHSRYREYNLSRHGLGWLVSAPAGNDYKGQVFRDEQANVRRIAEHIKTKHPDVYWIDLSLEVPDNLMFEGKPIYSDPAHMTHAWAKHLASLFSAEHPFIKPEDLKRR